ncbi:MAG: hypothetical protein R8P61_35840 [Bacteroidia bacterium]|nr:hypothetical protein [Bacteroidia bacterium]
MITDIQEIREKLVDMLKEHLEVLKINVDSYEKFEVSGTIEAMQGKKKVEGIYFSTVAPKAKDVRFYFFPCYTHKEKLGELPENLQKALKGKSCFHIKKMDEEFVNNLRDLVKRSVKLYQEDGLLQT